MQHLTQKQFEEYVRQRLQPADLLAVSDHLDECEACRLRIETAGEGPFLALRDEVFADLEQSGAHLAPAQLADYVDNALMGESQQVVTDHLSSCDHCSFAVADLREFRNELSPDREYRPAEKTGFGESWWRRSFGFLPAAFRVSPWPAFGGAALAVLLLSLIGWVILRKQSEQRPSQEIAVGPTPVVQPTPAPSFVPSPLPSASPAAVVAQLNDGGRVLTLDAEGKFSGADDLPAEYQKILKTALADQRLPRSSQLAGLTRPGSSLMSGNNAKDSFRVIEPVGTVTMQITPAFRWSPVTGASHYVAEVYDDKFNLIAASPELQTNSWTAATPLARGKIYAWQVKAYKDGEEITSPRPPAPQAKFRVLDEAKANQLAAARRSYPSLHLTLALLYADAGVLDESEEQLRELLKANPNSDIARKLLRQVQAQRR